MNKRKIEFFGSVSLILLVIIGSSYAYWSLTLTQTENNVVMTDCFEIEFIEGNAINLSKAYPVSDSDGMKNTPYTFTIKNICDSMAKYQINLETLMPNGKKLPDQYLKINLMEDNESKIDSKLDSSLNTNPTIEGAISAYQLLDGVLGPNKTKEFSLRIWMHSDVTASDKDSMNAIYSGNINVSTNYYQDKRGTLMVTKSGFEEVSRFKIYKINITKIVMEDEMNPKEAVLSFDLSENQDGSVMGHLVRNEDNKTYTFYIQSEGGIKGNPDSSKLFYGFAKIESIEGLEYFDTSNITKMIFMFFNCASLNHFDVSHFDTSNVIDMDSMFSQCTKLTNLDLSSFNTSKVISMRYMFDGCNSFPNLNVSHFDTGNVLNMSEMFLNCSSLTNLNLSHFDTSRVSEMRQLFSGCSSLTNIVYGENFIYTEGITIDLIFDHCPANKPTHESWNGVQF